MANYLSKVQMETGVVAEIRDANAHTLIGNLSTQLTKLSSELNNEINKISDNTPYVTPELFGAVGDGVTNDLVALQQTIDYASENCVPIVLSKKYFITGNNSRVSDGLTIKSNVHIIGNKNAELCCDDKCCFILDTKIKADYNSSNILKNVTIENVKFSKIDPTFFAFSHLINIGNADNLTIKGCHFYGWSGDAICFGASTNDALTQWYLPKVDNVKIIDNIFDGVNRNNRQCISWLDGRNITIERNVFKNCTRSDMPSAIDFESEHSTCNFDNVNILNNIFDGIGGISAINFSPWSSLSTVKNVKICGNTIKDAGIGVNIICDDSERNGFLICNNYIKCGRAFSIDGVNDCVIKGNNINGCKGSMLFSHTKKCENVVIKDNVFNDCCDDINYTSNFYFRATDNLSIKGNTFANPGYTLIAFYSGDVFNQVSVCNNVLFNNAICTNFITGTNNTAHFPKVYCYNNDGFAGKNIEVPVTQ